MQQNQADAGVKGWGEETKGKDGGGRQILVVSAFNSRTKVPTLHWSKDQGNGSAHLGEGWREKRGQERMPDSPEDCEPDCPGGGNGQKNTCLKLFIPGS